MNTTYVTAAAIAAVTLFAAPLAAHAVPEQLGFTARVTDNGTPITGPHVFHVRLYDAAGAGGSQVWTETINGTATDGLVYLTLGAQDALDADVLDGGPLWLEVQVGSTVLSPRLPVTSAAYAVRAGVAEDAELLGGQPSTAFAAAAHDHTGTYLPLGTTLACGGTQKVTAINANGSVTCGNDVDTSTAYTAGAGLSLSGTIFAAAFGGSGAASTVARSDHNHTGTYLPVGLMLACPTGQKVAALNPNGSVTCAADVDTNTTYAAGAGLSLSGNTFAAAFGGTGAANMIARSDHNHSGTYLPLLMSNACPAGQKVTGLNTNGSVACAVDATTTYSAGNGLTVSNNTFSVNYTGSNGVSNNAARADHTHAQGCPPNYGIHTSPTGGTALCVKPVSEPVTWNQASARCFSMHNGGELCTYAQMRAALQAGPTINLTNGHWLADRAGDNIALKVNGPDPEDFDGWFDVFNNNGNGYYCCQRAR